MSSKVETPIIQSASYDAASGVLTIETQNIGSNSFAVGDIDAEKLSLFTASNNSYELKNPKTIAIAPGSFTITITLSDTNKSSIAALLANNTNPLKLSAAKEWIENENLIAVAQKNDNAISVVVSNVIDTAAPDAPVITTSGNTTDDTTPTIEGTAEAGTIVTLHEGSTSLGSVQADSNGKWSITTSEIANGLHTLTAKATDAAGNTSHKSNEIAITIISEPNKPELTITGSTYEAATGILVISTQGYDIGTSPSGNPGNSFNVHPQEFTFSIGNQKHKLSAPAAATTIVNSSTIQITLNASDKAAIGNLLTLGTTYSLSADENWATGNGFEAEDDKNITLTIINPPITDTIAPTVTIGISDTNLKIGETSQVTFTFSEAIIGFSNDDLTIENGNLSTISSTDGGITWTAALTPTSDTEDPENVITLKAAGVTDKAGNTVSGITVSPNYAIDTIAPTIPQIITGNSITNDATPTFIGTGESGATITLFNDTNKDGKPDSSELLGTTTVAAGGNWKFIPSNELVDADYNVRAIQTDIAGNASTASESISITIDTAPPDITISNAALSADTGISKDDWITNEATQTITANLSAPPRHRRHCLWLRERWS